MKQSKKIAAAFLAVLIVFGCLNTSAMEVQAAPKTTTYVLDTKKGVCYPTKVRAGIRELNNGCSIYLVNEGDYVASVKSNSSSLIAKVTGKAVYTGDEYTVVRLEGNKEQKCRVRGTITYHARKKGTYTLTVTIKNAKKKTTCKKQIKVYAEEYATPVKSIKYAGKLYNAAGANLFAKKSGKLQVTMNKGFKLQKIEVGKFQEKAYKEYSPEPAYVKVKNKKKITLADSTKYKANVYSYPGEYYSYESGTEYDYLYPVTYVKVTYKDTRLGIVGSTEYELYYKNK